mmetsp:Transcript_1451/g.2753  ORF Transcript_1451/g.2753 Transcript_1451/m.2753 type:complete len:296 (+) Transcript_1451:505-1392(+)
MVNSTALFSRLHHTFRVCLPVKASGINADSNRAFGADSLHESLVVVRWQLNVALALNVGLPRGRLACAGAPPARGVAILSLGGNPIVSDVLESERLGASLAATSTPTGMEVLRARDQFLLGQLRSGLLGCNRKVSLHSFTGGEGPARTTRSLICNFTNEFYPAEVGMVPPVNLTLHGSGLEHGNVLRNRYLGEGDQVPFHLGVKPPSLTSEFFWMHIGESVDVHLPAMARVFVMAPDFLDVIAEDGFTVLHLFFRVFFAKIQHIFSKRVFISLCKVYMRQAGFRERASGEEDGRG